MKESTLTLNHNLYMYQTNFNKNFRKHMVLESLFTECHPTETE